MATSRGVGLGLLDDRLGERLRVAGRHRLRRPDQRVEHRRVVEVLLVVVLGRRVAAALLGEDVDDDRALGGQLDGVAQRLLELVDVVAVDRADVADAERLEERRRLEELAHGGLDRLDALLGLACRRRARRAGSSSSRRWRRTYTGLRRMLVSRAPAARRCATVRRGGRRGSATSAASAVRFEIVGA